MPYRLLKVGRILAIRHTTAVVLMPTMAPFQQDWFLQEKMHRDYPLQLPKGVLVRARFSIKTLEKSDPSLYNIFL